MGRVGAMRIPLLWISRSAACAFFASLSAAKRCPIGMFDGTLKRLARRFLGTALG